jgi:CHASE2 domain-containing sensor protein
MAERRETAERRTTGLALGLAAIVVCLGLRAAGALDGLELSVHDRFVRQRAGGVDTPSPLLTVSIGEDEFGRYGYPIPDRVLARALESLGRSGAAAIGVDLYRPGPASDAASDLEGWRRLGEVVARNPRIIMSERRPSDGEPGTPAPAFLVSR